ncbi:MAG: hypothetical protein IKA47_11405 [Oscillospiraceae bacterium]|nr:hypothetical protein [Oscillospiraceae bacterium]MBR2422031.1 hypothetical protein [Oscillospiraceae bacterium]
MDPIKISANTEFEVIYDDGTRRRVQEGVLFEVDDEKMIFHNGTNRASVLFAAAESALGLIDEIGLTKLFKAYISSDPEDTDTLRILARLISPSQRASAKEHPKEV